MNGSKNGKPSHLSLPVDISMANLRILEPLTLATDAVLTPQTVYGFLSNQRFIGQRLWFSWLMHRQPFLHDGV
jgi:hypothetical protein